MLSSCELHIWNLFLSPARARVLPIVQCCSFLCFSWFCLMTRLLHNRFWAWVRTGVCSGWSIVSILCLGFKIHTVDVKLQVVHRCVLPGLLLTSRSVCVCLVSLILNASDQTGLDLYTSPSKQCVAAVYLLCILEPT